MTTEELVKILEERGFRLRLLEDGTPSLRGPAREATPALLRVLAMHRGRLIERLKTRTQKKDEGGRMKDEKDRF